MRWGTRWPSSGAVSCWSTSDPQACLTYSVGIDPDTLDHSLATMCFVRKMKAARPPGGPFPEIEGLDILPSTIDLAWVPRSTSSPGTGREHVCPVPFSPVMDEYDVVLIDCPPSLGVLTINGLDRRPRGPHTVAVRSPQSPAASDSFSRRSMMCACFANADLQVRGVIATMYDERTRHSRAVLDDVKEAANGCLCSILPCASRSRFAEAP